MKNVATIFCHAAMVMALASCSDDEAPSGVNFPVLPQNFKIVGEASGNVEGLSIDCLCDLFIEASWHYLQLTPAFSTEGNGIFLPYIIFLTFMDPFCHL